MPNVSQRNNRGSKKLLELGVTGVVKRYIDTGGYGFITADDPYNDDVFFHISAVSKDNQRLGNPIRDGDRVIYDLYQASKGYRAESVRILDEDSEDTETENSGHSNGRKDTGCDSTRQGEGNRGRAGNRRRQQRCFCAERDQNRRDGSDRRGREQNIDDGNDSDYHGGWGMPNHDRMPKSNIRSSNVKGILKDPRRLSSGSSTQRPRADKRADGINKERFPDGAPFSRTDTSSDTWRKQGETRSKRHPSSRGFTDPMADLSHGKTMNPNDIQNTKKDTNQGSFRNKSSSPTRAPFKGSSQGTPNKSTTKKSDIGPEKSDTKSNPQQKPSSTYHGGSNRFSVKKESSSAGTSKKTPGNLGSASKAPRSDIGPNKSDFKTNPRPPPRKEANTNKKSYTDESQSQTGFSSEGNGQGTSNRPTTKESDIGSKKSNTDSNPQPRQSSNIYSYSYNDGLNRFNIPVNIEHSSKESSSTETSKPTPKTENASGDGEGYTSAHEPNVSTKDKDVINEDIKPKNTGPAANKQSNGEEATTSKENQFTGSTSKAATKAKTSTSFASITREAGNMLFRSARDTKIDMVKSMSFKSALGCYKKAHNWSHSDEELTSTAKNTAITSWRLATLKMANQSASDRKVHE